MPLQPPPVRRATAADVPAIAATLARAFHDDPVFAWACPPPGRRPAFGERFFAQRLRQLLALDDVWTTEDRAGAALWAPPGHGRMSLRETLELLPAVWAGRRPERLPLVLTGLERAEARTPSQPHVLLAVLGTDPAAQGRGVGSALLAPMLRECDQDGVPAFLKSSKERNIAFYARHGFRVTSELTLPRGPRVWFMWREPGS